MSALPSPLPTPHAPHSSWLSVEEAARRSGMNAGQIRRLCAEKWIAAGKARWVQGDGRRSRYEVHEEADPRFARVKFAEAIGLDLNHVTDAKRREAMRRKEILDGWERAKAGRFDLGLSEKQVTAQYVVTLGAKGVVLSRATLYLWYRAWRRQGPAGLIDGRGLSPDSPHPTPTNLFFAEVKRLYLLPRQLSLSTCYEVASMKATQEGWPTLSVERCRQLLKLVPQGVKVKYRNGGGKDSAYTAQCEPYIERDYTTIASNDLWCGDHYRFDVVVNDGGKLIRPWLTSWQDMRSRKIVGWHVFAHDPNTDTILLSFRRAVLEHGVPAGVYIDNGKDYDSYSLNGETKVERQTRRRLKIEIDPGRAGIFPGLGITVQHCWPYHGQSKPIERFHGTLAGDLPVWETYFGRDPQHRPEDYAKNLDAGKAPTLADFSAWFDAWLDGYNNSASKAIDLGGKSPNVVFAECLGVKRTTTAEALDACCLKRTPPVRVGKNGVTYQGLRYGQYEPALIALLGKEVCLGVDDGELASVQIWSTAGKFICIAPANRRLPVNASAQELREAIEEKRQAKKAVNAYYEKRPRLSEDLPDLIVRARAARNAVGSGEVGSGETPPPPSIQPIRSLITDQLPAVQRAIESRSNHFRATGTDDASPAFSYSSLPTSPLPTDQNEPPSFRELMARRQQEGGEGE